MSDSLLRPLIAPDIPWQTLYPQVARVAREYLSTLPQGDTITTATLARALWDADTPVAPRLYRALNVLSRHALSDCWVCGPETKIYGTLATPKLWHMPDPSRTVVPSPVALRSPEHAFAARVAAMDETSAPDILDWMELVSDARKLATGKG